MSVIVGEHNFTRFYGSRACKSNSGRNIYFETFLVDKAFRWYDSAQLEEAVEALKRINNPSDELIHTLVEIFHSASYRSGYNFDVALTTRAKEILKSYLDHSGDRVLHFLIKELEQEDSSRVGKTSINCLREIISVLEKSNPRLVYKTISKGSLVAKGLFLASFDGTKMHIQNFTDAQVVFGIILDVLGHCKRAIACKVSYQSL